MNKKTKKYIHNYLLMPMLLFCGWLSLGLIDNLASITKGNEPDISFLIFTIMLGIGFAIVVFIIYWIGNLPNINVKKEAIKNE